MDFEKEAREIADYVGGDPNYNSPPDEIAFIVAILRRAYAAGQENMSEWQPIETAPKDGTEILATRADWWAPVNGNHGWVFSPIIGTKWDEGQQRFSFGNRRQPTHWRPMIAPPVLSDLHLKQVPKVNEFASLATTKDIGLE